MTTHPSLAAELFQTQMAFCQEAGRLLRDYQKNTFDLGSQALVKCIEESEAERQAATAPLGQGAALPAAAACMRGLEGRVKVAQAIAQGALNNQTSFAAAYWSALGDWRQASLEAMSRSGLAMADLQRPRAAEARSGA